MGLPPKRCSRNANRLETSYHDIRHARVQTAFIFSMDRIRSSADVSNDDEGIPGEEKGKRVEVQGTLSALKPFRSST